MNRLTKSLRAMKKIFKNASMKPGHKKDSYDRYICDVITDARIKKQKKKYRRMP